MRLKTALLLISIATLTIGCSRDEEKGRPALEQAQEKLKASMDEAETRLAEGTAEARKALVAAMKRWDELRPEAERAIASIEGRVGKFVHDTKALQRLSPETLARVRARLEDMRKMLAEAKAAHERGNTDLAIEKADDVQKERAAIEELLVEKPDPPAP